MCKNIEKHRLALHSDPSCPQTVGQLHKKGSRNLSDTGVSPKRGIPKSPWVSILQWSRDVFSVWFLESGLVSWPKGIKSLASAWIKCMANVRLFHVYIRFWVDHTYPTYPRFPKAASDSHDSQDASPIPWWTFRGGSLATTSRLERPSGPSGPLGPLGPLPRGGCPHGIPKPGRELSLDGPWARTNGMAGAGAAKCCGTCFVGFSAKETWTQDILRE